MMVVHDDTETPVEVAVIRKPVLEQKSYVIVKNHVRELINTDESTSSINKNIENSPQKSKNVKKSKQESGKKRKHKNNEQIQAISAESEVNTTNTETDIDKNDLQELKTVYMKCKEVINKIETKYGHLLDLNTEVEPSSCRKRKAYAEETSEEDCDCQLKRKIVFDDDGKQSTVEMVPEKHICVKKVKNTHSRMTTRSKNISVEYTDHEIKLPDNLQELSSLLHDPDIEKPLRNKIVGKIRALKRDYVNDIRFNKHALIEKVKNNPDDVLGFKGTNLSTIPGYT